MCIYIVLVSSKNLNKLSYSGIVKLGVIIMKKIFAMFAVFLFAIMLGRVYHIDPVSPGESLEVFATYHNLGSERAEDMKLSVYIPDLGVYYRSNVFTISPHDNGGQYMLPRIPADAESGWHAMWVMLTGENQRDYMFDWVYVG